MKIKRTTYEKSISYVEHKKNFQRTLHTFSKHNRNICIKLDKPSKSWRFECLYNLENLSDNTEVVYNPLLANEMLKDTSAIINAIDGMFEYKKYTSVIKDLVASMEKSKEFNGVKITINMFFQKDAGAIKDLLKYKLEEVFPLSLTDKNVSKIYNSIKNRVCFKPIYCDIEGQYYTYEGSQLDRFVLCTPSYSPKDHVIRKLVKEYYENYNKYYHLIPLAENAFEYYLNQNDTFSQTDPITIEWKEKYEFLKESGILRSLYQSMDFLNSYMYPFHNEEAYPLHLFASNEKMYNTTIKNHLKKIITKKSLKSINIMHWKKMYRVLIKEIPAHDWQMIFLSLMQWPEIYDKYPSIFDQNIEYLAEIKKNKYLPIPF